MIVPAGNFACVHIEDLTISILNECNNILNFKRVMIINYSKLFTQK